MDGFWSTLEGWREGHWLGGGSAMGRGFCVAILTQWSDWLKVDGLLEMEVLGMWQSQAIPNVCFYFRYCSIL